ncbi:MAG: hypothetical protein UGF43_01550 [Blautia sp.]|uniref:hypothetical protein n=1 Tax=Blautia sp. TaxID=1955243 RepID=UPI002E79C425|nr:hypothetical protein [Blautia sp.]MEE1442296.1 hypothetical protein [Blautia sp.]
MSLIVYTKKSQFSKEDFILDVNSSFKGCNFSGSDFCKRVVSGIDRGTYLNSTSFIDRFGYKLYSKFLSTTSKALICLDEFPDRVVNFCEVGNDVGNYILEKTKGRVYIPEGRIKYVLNGYKSTDVDVVIAGKSFKNADDMYWYLEEEYV